MTEHTLRVERTALYYVRMPDDQINEIWFLLHGYGDLAPNFLAEFDAIASPGRALVAPEGLSRYYRRGTSNEVGASWMTRVHREFEIADYVRYLDSVYADVVQAFATRSAELTVLGFSQGGATAARWMLLGQSPISRLIVWGSDVPPDLDTDLLRTRSANVPIELVIGTSDEFVTEERVGRDVRRLDENGVSFRLIRYDGSHQIDVPTLRELAAGS